MWSWLIFGVESYMSAMKYALINGVLLDGTEAMQPRPGLTVLVNGDRIEALVPAGDEGAG